MSVWESVQQIRKMASYPSFAGKYADEAKALTESLKKFNGLIKDVGQREDSLGVAVTNLHNEHQVAEEALAELKKAATPNAEAIKTAEETLTKAKTAFHDFYSGKTDINGVKVSEELKSAYGKVGEAAEAASKIMNGMFGKVKVNGWKAAFKDNLAFYDDAVTKGRGKQVYGRCGGVLVGAAMTADAIFRSKTGDNEARGTLTRVLEGATGLAVAGGSAFAGAAR